jgi:predicted DNA-binding transcriptional regulator AlpA
MGQNSKAPDLSNFNALPDTARADLPVVCALFSVSPATAWRRVKAGVIPSPIKDGRCTRWIVGDLRRALAVDGGGKATEAA